MIPKEGLSCIYYINSDDTLLAGSFDGSLLLIDVCTFQLLDKVTAQRDTILQIVYSRVILTIRFNRRNYKPLSLLGLTLL